MIATSNIHAAVEALVLASPEPLPVSKICDVVSDLTPSKAAQAVAELNTRYSEGNSSFRIREIAGGYQFYVLAEYTGYIEELFTRHRKLRLTQAALETLAIVAYKQPVTKSEIEHIRGVASDGVLHTLLERNMVSITGRAKGVGKALQYGTTDEFLKFFGLSSLEALPKLSEIDELMAATASQAQTMLNLSDPAAAARLMAKLNVADGTFNPASRERDEETGEQPGVDITGNDEHRTLVLKSRTEDNTFTDLPESDGLDEDESLAANPVTETETT
jgi:segregation and condensation protein B